MAGRDVFAYPPDDPARIRKLGRVLHHLHTALGKSQKQVDGQWAALSDRWLGAAGSRACDEIHHMGGVYYRCASALEPLQGAANTFAQALDTARTTIDGLRSGYDDAETEFQTKRALTPVGGPSVNPAFAEALDTRNAVLDKLTARHEDVLDTVRRAGRRLGEQLLEAAGTWSSAPASANPGLARLQALEALRFMAPWDSGLTITRTDGLVIIDTGPNADKITTRVDAASGDVIVVINGVEHRFTAAEARGLVIRTGGGTDEVEVAPGTLVGFTILTGDGDDKVSGGWGADLIGSGAGNDDVKGGGGDDAADLGYGNDQYHEPSTPTFFGGMFVPIWARSGQDVVAGGEGDDLIKTGEGADHVDGGRGKDRIDTGRGDDTVDGGEGDDRIYSGLGDDRVRGGAGNDYLEGGAGKDSIDGGAGDDLVSGGRDGDHLVGGAGNDTFYTGAGQDKVIDYEGNNTVYRQAGDDVDDNATTVVVTIELAEIPGNIRIEGSPDFVDRAQADLDLLASSPTGQRMLERIGEVRDQELVIRELTPEEQKLPIAGIQPTVGDTNYAAITPHIPGIDVMYHEISHADARMHGAFADGMYTGGQASHMPQGLDDDKDGFVSFEELDRNDDDRIDDDDLDLNHDGEVNGDDGWLPNLERQASGEGIDPDNDPRTPDVPAWTIYDQPEALTVNALRREMGMPPV